MIATISEKLIENFSKKFCDKKLCFSSAALQLQETPSNTSVMSLKLPKYKDDHILSIKYGTTSIQLPL